MNRKEMVRDYKKTRRPMGVFCIRNTLTGQVLLGSSVDLPSILNRYRMQLEMGMHPNRQMQNDWNALQKKIHLLHHLLVHLNDYYLEART